MPKINTLLTVDAVEVVKSIPFYFGSPNVEDGTERRSATYWIRALIMLDTIIAANKGGRINISKAKSFRDAIYNYGRMNEVLDSLRDAGLLVYEEAVKHTASRYHVPTEYVSEGSFVEVSESEFRLYTRLRSKAAVRGAKATTDGRVTIEIDFETFSDLMKGTGKESDKIADQWRIIEEINRTGQIHPKQKRSSRLYSDFTNLSKVVHPFIRIDGSPVCSLDQHATYFTLLPLTFRSRYHRMTDDQTDCVRKLDQFVKDTTNIYENIAEQTGMAFAAVKELTNSFLCDPVVYEMKEGKGILQKWFKANFPECSEMLDKMRANKAAVSKFMKLESDIFVGSAKRLRKQNIQVITKHDALFCYRADLDKAESTLLAAFIKAGVSAKLKRDIPYPCSVAKAPSGSSSVLADITLVPTNGKTIPLNEGEEGRTIVYGFPDRRHQNVGTKEGEPMCDFSECRHQLVGNIKTQVIGGREYWRFQKRGYKEIRARKDSMNEDQFREYVTEKIKAKTQSEPDGAIATEHQVKPSVEEIAKPPKEVESMPQAVADDSRVVLEPPRVVSSYWSDRFAARVSTSKPQAMPSEEAKPQGKHFSGLSMLDAMLRTPIRYGRDTGTVTVPEIDMEDYED